MKKILTLLTVVLLGFSVNDAFAQPTTGATTLKVTLSQAQSIVIGQAEVPITFSTPSDYINGKSSGAQASHIKISSTGKFTVLVKGPTTDVISNGTAADDIPLAALSLTPAFEMSSTALTNQTFPLAGGPITIADQALIKADSGANEAFYSVNYHIAAGAAGVNVLNRTTGTTSYNAVITYTITPN